MAGQEKISVHEGTTKLLKKIRKHTEDYGWGNLGFLVTIAVFRLANECDDAFDTKTKKPKEEFIESLINDTMLLEDEGIDIKNLRNVDLG